MKSLFLTIVLFSSTWAMADYSCTSIIRDNGQDRESFTRYSYSEAAACDTANFDCNNFLSHKQSMGQYRFAYCVAIRTNNPDYPYPDYPYPTDPIPSERQSCQTDLIDYWGQVIRSFTGNGRTLFEACDESDRFCQSALNRGTSNGRTCVRRNTPNPRPPRDPWITAECKVQRLDPAGWLVQEYTSVKSGPRSQNPRMEACREAERACSYDLRGRQSCRII